MNHSLSAAQERAMPSPALRIDGNVQQPLDLTFDDLQAVEGDAQVPDVSRFQPKRRGDAVTLGAILERVRPTADATYLTLHASLDDFAATVPLAAVRDEALVVYRVDGAPMTAEAGGPFRFLIKNPAACHTDALDECANVKYLDRIELTAGPGRDTRPETDAEHDALHEHEHNTDS
jgi:2-dehydropantoate 2-reductase